MLRHSEGFNPHPYLSILVPLSVGYESECELLDFQLHEDASCADLTERLNGALPEGITALHCGEPIHAVKELSFARYRVFFRFETENMLPELERLFESDDIIVAKKSKSGVKDVNLRELIRRLDISEEGGGVTLEAELPSAINPSLLEAAVRKYLPDAQPAAQSYIRTAFLLSEGADFV